MPYPRPLKLLYGDLEYEDGSRDCTHDDGIYFKEQGLRMLASLYRLRRKYARDALALFRMSCPENIPNIVARVRVFSLSERYWSERLAEVEAALNECP